MKLITKSTGTLANETFTSYTFNDGERFYCHFTRNGFDSVMDNLGNPVESPEILTELNVQITLANTPKQLDKIKVPRVASKVSKPKKAKKV